MGACSNIGRVGGLAFALGIGAAVLGGTAVACADDGADTAPARHARASAESSAHPDRPAASVRSRAVAPRAAVAERASAAVPVARAALAPAAVAPAATVSAPDVASAAEATQPLILGPSGVPIPRQRYIDTVMSYYVIPNSPEGTLAPVPVFTPEGLYPITGVKSLPLDTSVDEGLLIVQETMSAFPVGTTNTVFGYSQSAIIGSLLQAGYNESTVPVGLADTTSFIFVGNEMNPNGGFLSRFPDLNMASLGIPFYGATPENAYPTTNYTLEYDGFADFPRYPLNFLADLNAALGIAFVHINYTPALNCRSFCTTKEQVENAIALPSTSPTERYFFIPNENLPLLQPLRDIPIIGKPIADLIQPVLKVIVNLGYGDPAHGFESGIQPYANVNVPFGLFPSVDPMEVFSQLVAGVQQGISDFINDFGPHGSIVQELSALSLPTLSFDFPTPEGIISGLQDLVLTVGNRIAASVSGLYAAVLPTADIVTAALTTLPTYGINLVLGGIQQMLTGDLIGGLVNAIGMPIAATVGLLTMAGLLGAASWGESVLAFLNPDIAPVLEA